MKKKIKIMFIAGELGIGGLERVVTNLCKHLNKNKYHVTACCINLKGEFADELEKDNIKVHLVSQNNSKPNYFAFWKLKNILNQVKPDIVHTHNTDAFIDGAIASILAKVPIIVHTDHARVFPDKKRYMLMEWFLSHFTDKIIAVSNETKENLIRYERINRNKISIINNGIDGKIFDVKINCNKKQKELKLEKFDCIVGLGVRLTKQKGIINLIHAAPEVLTKFPRTAFVIAGLGILRKQLEDEVKKMKLQSNVFFLGPRLDMPEILQLLDIYVLPSDWEGLPLVILEAMAAGKAIIATDVGGNSVAIEDGRSGYLVPPKTPSILAEKICELILNIDKRKKFGESAKKKFFNEFSIEFMIKEHEKIYKQICAEKGIE